MDAYLQTMPTRWPTRRTEDGDVLPLVPPAIRTAGVDREGRLWIALTSPFTYVYDGAGDKIRTVQFKGADIADAEQPVLHQGRPHPRHARLLRVPSSSILTRAHARHEVTKTPRPRMLALSAGAWMPSPVALRCADGEEEDGSAEEGRGGIRRADAGGGEDRSQPARSTRWRRRSRRTAAPCSAATTIRSAAQPLLLVALPVAQRRADAVPARSVRRARQAADGRGREDRALPRSDHRHPPRGQVLDAERQSPAAGAEEARRPHDRRAARAGSEGRVQDPRAQHREGAQPAREVARDDPHGARARRREDVEGRARERLRLRVRAAVVPDARRRLRGTPAPERRRLPADPPPRRRVPRRADEQGAEGARAARPQDPEAGRCGAARRSRS